MKLRKSKLRKITVVAGDDVAGVMRVKIKLQILGKRAKLKQGMCAYLSLKTGHRIVHRCNRGFNKVKAGETWELRIPAKVRRKLRRRDRYSLMIRVRDMARNYHIFRIPFRVR